MEKIYNCTPKMKTTPEMKTEVHIAAVIVVITNIYLKSLH